MSSSLIALIAYERPEPPGPAEIREVLEPGFGGALEVYHEGDGPILELNVGGAQALVAPGNGPIDPGVLEPACDGAWYWPDAARTFSAHQSHLVVVIKEVTAADSKVKSLLLTRLVGLLGPAFDYLGVYWEPSATVHSAAAFRESSERMDERQLPLRLWVRFEVVENKDGTHSLFTQGLEPLGLPELEVRASRRPPENIQGWAFNIAHFILDRGAPVADGETVGVSPQEWIRVYHLPGAIDPERTVLFLDLDMDEEMNRGGDS